jgi:hypothetical protein
VRLGPERRNPVKSDTPRVLGARANGRFQRALVFAGLVACAAVCSAVAAAAQLEAQTARVAVPSAAEFARHFVALTDGFAQESGDVARVAHPDCVQASPGHYMCSYVVTRPGRTDECHLMQAKWTPERASTITVTLAGRTRQCGSLRQALDSLR